MEKKTTTKRRESEISKAAERGFLPHPRHLRCSSHHLLIQPYLHHHQNPYLYALLLLGQQQLFSEPQLPTRDHTWTKNNAISATPAVASGWVPICLISLNRFYIIFMIYSKIKRPKFGKKARKLTSVVKKRRKQQAMFKKKDFNCTPISGFQRVLIGFVLGSKQSLPDEESSLLPSFKTKQRYLQRKPDTSLKGAPSNAISFPHSFSASCGMRGTLNLAATQTKYNCYCKKFKIKLLTTFGECIQVHQREWLKFSDPNAARSSFKHVILNKKEYWSLKTETIWESLRTYTERLAMQNTVKQLLKCAIRRESKELHT
ncbi:hypothetical protein MKW98_000207 [Papaver atlanticum]|uniref:Uncharacterized protein n=1 Tax=Papaver atlanticum TaxID=357466 RepID=A0AAD4XJF2_9MAGN|nr:hypothetical protein MKW98_000207 [Papaver atlanticum]